MPRGEGRTADKETQRFVRARSSRSLHDASLLELLTGCCWLPLLGVGEGEGS